MIHGDADPVVPVESLATATNALEAVDVPVSKIERPGLGHGNDEHGLSTGGAFLREQLGD